MNTNILRFPEVGYKDLLGMQILLDQRGVEIASSLNLGWLTQLLHVRKDVQKTCNYYISDDAIVNFIERLCAAEGRGSSLLRLMKDIANDAKKEGVVLPSNAIECLCFSFERRIAAPRTQMLTPISETTDSFGGKL